MAVDEARLKATVEKQENCVRVIEVEVQAEELSEHMERLFAELAPSASVPGFRPGRAPKKLLQRKFRKTIHQQAVDEVVAESFETVCETENLRPISEPGVEDIKTEEDGLVSYRVTVEVEPVVELGEYKGLELKKEVCIVTDENVEFMIEQLRESRATIEPVEGRDARIGDSIVFDIDVFDGDTRVEDVSGEGLNLWIQEDPSMPELQQLVLETEPGRQFEGEITFPENVQSSVAGKRVRVSGNVKEIKERVLPELNDKFANEVDPELKTIDELRVKVRDILEREADQEADQRLRMAAVDRVVENSTYELPNSIVEQLAYENLRDRASRLRMVGMDEQVLRERHNELWEACRQEAEQSVKMHATLAAIIELENIEVSDEDVEKEIDSIREYGERMGWNIDRLDEHYEQRSSLDSIQSRLTREKTVQFLIDSAKVDRVEVEAPSEVETDDDTTETEGN